MFSSNLVLSVITVLVLTIVKEEKMPDQVVERPQGEEE